MEKRVYWYNHIILQNNDHSRLSANKQNSTNNNIKDEKAISTIYDLRIKRSYP